MFVQEEQVQYLDDSEVDFSSDADDEEEDMEDFDGADGARPASGWLGKRPAGTYAFLAVVIVLGILHDDQCCVSAMFCYRNGCCLGFWLPASSV